MAFHIVKIKRLLQKYVGAVNAISALEISTKLGFGDTLKGNLSFTRKQITKTIDQMKAPIGANHRGYFWIDTEEELTIYICNLEKRKAKIEKRIDMIVAAYLDDKEKCQKRLKK